MLFPVVMYGCESWTVEKAERHIQMLFVNDGNQIILLLCLLSLAVERIIMTITSLDLRVAIVKINFLLLL